MSGDPDEIALARAVARGDRAALDRFHSLYFDAVYRFIDYRTGGVKEASEEVAQETFLAALESLGRYRGESPSLVGCAASRAT